MNYIEKSLKQIAEKIGAEHTEKFKCLSELFGELTQLSQRENEILEEIQRLTTELKNACDRESSPRIEVLGLSNRALNCLKSAEIENVADILNYPKYKWGRIRNFGKITAKEIEQTIAKLGYKDFHIT